MGETVLSNELPIHPRTGLQALGLSKSGKPIWPVMGGSQPLGDPQQQNNPAPPPSATLPPQFNSTTPPAPTPSGPAAGPDATDKGFPENTPVAQMTPEQQTAYWKHYARKHEARANAFGDLTPEQVQQMQARNEELENQQLSASDKALKDAVKQGRAEAEADWKPKYLNAKLEAAAAAFFPGDPDKLAAFMATANAAAFLNDASGEVDTDKVTAHLTTLFGAPSNSGQQQNGNQQQPNWGQHGGRPPTQQPGEGGRAEAERRKARQGVKT